MRVYEQLLNGEKALAVVGLGYVGMPLAIEFAKKIRVIGYDKSKEKINSYKKGIDATGEVSNEAIRNTTALFSDDDSVLADAAFYIVAVPTPIAEDKTPDLSSLVYASRDVGRHLKKGDIVVYESTVYPGVTEEVCVPILERESGLACGTDFKVGYSPERINPGDKVHTVTKVLKIVSGMDDEALEEISQVYSIIVEAGVYKAESIKVAEAAKVIENTQRDLNIALMNELSIIFNKMNINTKAVLEAAGTKWNFLKFTPGLVGGHCIGVDPYYLAYKAQQLGYHPEVILAGRRINDAMGKFVAENTVKQLIKADKQIKGAKALIMGITFKEDVPDTRNTKVADIISELSEYGIKVYVTDPVADREEVMREYAIDLQDFDEVNGIDAIILAVAHKQYREIPLERLKEKYSNGTKVLVDVKSIISPKEAERQGFLYWSL
ncbi:MAG TPA: nucleotide sugar dehydrogenase [Ruminiclostridium sp.]|jgi:UDP-N-acetyl-D-galactosamine dehydrogenase|nr:nucleotide sugar dehydrogenase [Clostridiaceae bacterium]HAA26256.1 nucleotide sugar dehydrogenase [Ruminiclostridium sp.]